MKIPSYARLVLDHLTAAGFEAWVVGGCVRDALAGRTPHDWDITTSARPEEVRAALPYPVIDTGIAHGTVTAVVEGEPVEITTYRVEGSYSDARRPDWVAFTPHLHEDLARRDFTINAMAAREEALCDPFGGQADLAAGMIRAVGDPFLRFGEDALRILRALRFAATLGFTIEPETARAIFALKDNLKQIAPERIAAELVRLVTGAQAAAILREYAPVVAVFLPEILPAMGFDQRNHHHIWDVWEHTLHAMEASPPDKDVRLCLLFHDLGKPQTFTIDAKGTGHFYGHNAVSGDMCHAALRRLRFDSATIRNVETLVRYHDADLLATPKSIRRWLRRMGADWLNRLIDVKRGDNLAQAPAYQGRQDELTRARQEIIQILGEKLPFSLAHLAVNGKDMISLGFTGKAIGAALEALLEDVIEERCPNEREALLKRAAKLTPL